MNAGSQKKEAMSRECIPGSVKDSVSALLAEACSKTI